jgi:gas vesicle protein
MENVLKEENNMKNGGVNIRNILLGVLVGIVITAVAGYVVIKPQLTKASEETNEASTTTTQTSSSQNNTSIQTNSGTTNSSTSATTPTPAPSTSTTTQESTTSSTSSLLLNSAIVTQVAGQALTVSSLGNTYTIDTNGNTNFLTINGGKGSLTEVAAHDLVNVTGNYTNSSKTIILATQIMDLSLQQASLTGLIDSINIVGGSFTMNLPTFPINNLTVYTNGSTLISDKNGKTANMSNINVGDTVTVTGVWDSANNLVTNPTNVTDLNISL